MCTSTYPYVSELRAQGQAEGRVEGRAEGRAEAIIHILGRRHVPLTDADRARILGSRDEPTLELWLDRSLTVTTAAELFAQ